MSARDLSSKAATALPQAASMQPPGEVESESKSIGGPGIYKLAICLSLLSVGLGIMREYLFIHFLGLSRQCDELQAHLSVIYIVSLSGDAVRLTLLNRFSDTARERSAFTVMLCCIVWVIVVGALVRRSIAFGPVFYIAILSGLLNLLWVGVLTLYQAGGDFLKAHIVSTCGNIFFIPCFLIIAALTSDGSLVMYTLFAFAALPALQIAVLLNWSHARIFDFGSYRNATDRSIAFPVARAFALQNMPSAANQVFQTAFRAALLGVGEGYLSLYALVFRIYEAARSVFIETYIGNKLNAWKNNSQAELQGIRAIHWSAAAAILGCIIAATMSMDTRYRFLALILLIMVPAFGLLAMNRVIYFWLNIRGLREFEVFRVGALELLVGAVIYLLLDRSIVAVSTAMITWFLLKNLALTYLLRYCVARENPV